MTSSKTHSVDLVLTDAQVQSVVRQASSRTDQRVTGAERFWENLLGDDSNKLSRSLLRGLRTLAAFAPDQPRSVTSLAADLEMNTSTASRYVRTLLQIGLLEQCKDRTYKLPAGSSRDTEQQ